MKEYAKEDNILMNLTETWFDNTVWKVVEIEGYNIFRGDTKGTVRGDTANYLHEKIEASKIYEMSNKEYDMSNKEYDMVAIMIPDIQTLIIVIYRPLAINQGNSTIFPMRYKGSFKP